MRSDDQPKRDGTEHGGLVASQAAGAWYEKSFASSGIAAQRSYPNEEVIRFLARHFLRLPKDQRQNVRVLEVGCGSGANLWMMAREGFDVHGIDLSPSAIGLCKQVLQHWNQSAEVKVGDMTAVEFPDRYFDAIVDVFSSYCLDEAGFSRFLNEVARLLRPGGKFFSYAPSKASDAFRNPGPSRLIDSSTLDGIRRLNSPYCGNLYPFRFISVDEYRHAIENCGLHVMHCETVSRTYRNGDEYFEFVVIDGEK